MILIFLKNLQSRSTSQKRKKTLTLKSASILLNGKQKLLNAFKSGIFPNGKQTQGKGRPSILAHTAKVSNRKVSDCKQLKIIIHKQMLQRLPIAFAQVEAGNTSENLLNEIRRLKFSLHRAKKITQKIYNNIMNSLKL